MRPFWICTHLPTGAKLARACPVGLYIPEPEVVAKPWLKQVQTIVATTSFWFPLKEPRESTGEDVRMTRAIQAC